METPQTDPAPGTGEPQTEAGNMDLRFQVPRAWYDEFREIAHERAISMADLLRQMLREFMRNSRAA